MSSYSTLNSVSVSMRLNNGTKDGKVQTVGVSIGKIEPNYYDYEKAWDLRNAIAPMLSKSVYRTVETTVSNIL